VISDISWEQEWEGKKVPTGSHVGAKIEGSGENRPPKHGRGGRNYRYKVILAGGKRAAE